MKPTEMPERLKALEPFWGSWRLDRCLGVGAYGSVYRITQESFGLTYEAALKWIPLSAEEADVQRLKSQGVQGQGIDTYFRDLVSNLQREIRLLSELQGTSYVVSYQDHSIHKRTDSIGYDILIRMELLTGLEEYLSEHALKQQDVVQLGIDLCSALELCQRKNIIHRDIKPGNIFISPNGNFKLGDFGIARRMEQTSKFMTVGQGTLAYMAPDIKSGEGNYGSEVDMYSLGLVMYQLVNGNRGPFMPMLPEPFTAADEDMALVRRFRGDPLPKPACGSDRLKEIILKACAFDPAGRYSSPVQMREDLIAILDQQSGSVALPGFPVGAPYLPDDLARDAESHTQRLVIADEAGSPHVRGTNQLPVGPRQSMPEMPSTSPLEPPDKLARTAAARGQEARSEKTIEKINMPSWLAVTLLVVLVLAGLAWRFLRAPAVEGAAAKVLSPVSVSLSWHRGGGPWGITAVPKGQKLPVAEQNTAAASIELSGLIPGLTHEVTIRDEKTGAQSTLSVRLPDAPRASNMDYALEYTNFGFYRHADLSRTVDFRELVQQGRFTQPYSDDMVLTLSNKPMESQQDGYLLMYKLIVVSQELRQLPQLVQLVLRLGSGPAFSISHAHKPDQVHLSDTFHLDEALDQLWNELGAWPQPQDTLTMELYAGGSLLLEKPFIIRSTGVD